MDAHYIIFIGFPIVPQEIPPVQYRTAKNRKMPTKKAPAAEKCAGGAFTIQILLMCLSRVFYRFFDFLLEKGRIKLNPQQLWIFEKAI